MLFDFSSFSNQEFGNRKYDFAIAGAGVAGIILALKLSRQQYKVILIESGGLEFSAEVQQLYDGEILGNPYFNLMVTRLRYFGGSSNHWGGMCHPLEDFDFDAKHYVPSSGWPINKRDLDPYLAEAAKIVDIAGDFSNIGESIFASTEFSAFQRINFNFSEPTRLGQKYLQELKNSEFVDVFINCTVTNVHLGNDYKTVSGFDCVSSIRAHEYSYNAVANNFVLALGGLENPRLLLSSASQIPSGIGNQRDLVGRYFLEHPTFTLGTIYPTSNLSIFWKLEFKAKLEYLICKSKIAADAVRSYRGWLGCLDEEFLRPKAGFILNNEIMNCGLRITKIFNDENQDILLTLRASAEQRPNPNSRVRLIDDRDALGMQKIGLDWKLAQEDKNTLLRCALQMGKELAQNDAARIKLEEWLLEDNSDFPGLGEDELAGHHHMGTTRMASSPQNGVVDSNLLVYGTNNLYVCGSSVYPTSGFANPTFTICQLSLRLADHLTNV